MVFGPDYEYVIYRLCAKDIVQEGDEFTLSRTPEWTSLHCGKIDSYH